MTVLSEFARAQVCKHSSAACSRCITAADRTHALMCWCVPLTEKYLEMTGLFFTVSAKVPLAPCCCCWPPSPAAPLPPLPPCCRPLGDPGCPDPRPLGEPGCCCCCGGGGGAEAPSATRSVLRCCCSSSCVAWQPTERHTHQQALATSLHCCCSSSCGPTRGVGGWLRAAGRAQHSMHSTASAHSLSAPTA